MPTLSISAIGSKAGVYIIRSDLHPTLRKVCLLLSDHHRQAGPLWQASHGDPGLDRRVWERHPCERQQDVNNKAKAESVRFGPKPLLTLQVVQKIKKLRSDGATVPEIMRRTKLSKASV